MVPAAGEDVGLKIVPAPYTITDCMHIYLRSDTIPEVLFGEEKHQRKNLKMVSLLVII